MSELEATLSFHVGPNVADKPFLTFTKEGKIIVGEGYTLDEAGRAFIKIVSEMWARNLKNLHCAHCNLEDFEALPCPGVQHDRSVR